MNDDDITFAAECAFNRLLDEAAHSGARIYRPIGLINLSNQELARDFIDACRAILKALETTL